jgi:hypothetical protein
MRITRQFRITSARCAAVIALALAVLTAAHATQSDKSVPHPVVLRAVYLVKETGELSAADLKAHPDVAVVHTWANFQAKAAGQTVALWIDKDAMSLVQMGGADVWLNREPQKWYPVIMVGYNDCLYAFRELMPYFGIKGPPVDWSQRKVEPGFSLWKLQDESTTGRSATMHGFEIKPTVSAIERLTESWLSAHKSQAKPVTGSALQENSKSQGR